MEFQTLISVRSNGQRYIYTLNKKMHSYSYILKYGTCGKCLNLKTNSATFLCNVFRGNSGECCEIILNKNI